MRFAIFVAAALVTWISARADESPHHFDTQIIPILTKAGCNAGACHGAAVGRGGFKLSLWGSNPKLDYDAIVHDLEGRRVNLVRPEVSLVLAKPTGVLNHGGGERLEYEGRDARTIEAWIRAGAPRGAARRLTEFQIAPERAVLPAVGSSVTMRATARFVGGDSNEGEPVDVTPWVVFTPTDPAAVQFDQATNTAAIHRRGRHLVIARYLDRVVPLQWTVPLGDKAVDLAREPRHNFIDDHVLETLAELRLKPSPVADDAAFMRRVKLDLTGRLPQPEEIATFLSDKRPDKRARLVDALLASDEFVQFWTWRVATWLRIRSGPNDAQGTKAYHTWLRDQIGANRSFLKVAQDLVTADGDSHEYGPANFHRSAGDARGEAEYFSEALLGVRLRCANCHNHPLDRWTQDDYHGLAAVFARMERGRNVRMGSRGEVIHPATAEPAVPRLPGGPPLPFPANGKTADGNPADNRPALAEWLGKRDNPTFARATVNRLWKAMFGRGLVEPVDDLRATNPATHPELLSALTNDFVEHGYDLRHTLRLIVASEAYQRSSQTVGGNGADDRFYSHALYRPLEAEVLSDAIAEATGAPDENGRAIEIFDPAQPVESLDILGRCSRADSCDSTVTAAGGLTAKLHLLNGPLINEKLRSPKGRLQALLAARKTNEEIITEMYFRALSHQPPKNMLAYWLKHGDEQAKRESRTQFLEDFCWALLNSRDFTNNH